MVSRVGVRAYRRPVPRQLEYAVNVRRQFFQWVEDDLVRVHLGLVVCFLRYDTLRVYFVSVFVRRR